MPEVEYKENKQLIEELCRDQYYKEILRFFARHPFARFDKQVLVGGLGLSDTRRIEVSLDNLAEQKLIETRNGYGAPLYWLTRHEPAHSAITSALIPRTSKEGGVMERLSMMQLIMPLGPCPIMAASVR